MKRILLLITIVAIAGITSMAQDTMYVHQKGGIVTRFAVDKIDSVLFKTSDVSVGTTIRGYAQKGPFINGSSITVYDLQANFSPSGKSYSEQITDNKGTFELFNLSLSSDFVSLRADGFYYNEVSGKQSASQITLLALADISGKNNLNINLLTHLEKARVEYLMRAGKGFFESKTQAQKEIMAIFNIESSQMKVSESLNIAEQGEENAVLLAISAIIQGFRSESEMTELLSNISNDIKTDGILNNAAVGSALINHAVFLDTVEIRNNLVKRYTETGEAPAIPYFGKYISNFIKNSLFQITQSLFTYSETGLHGFNILSLSKTDYIASWNTSLSMAADLAKGTALKIRISAMDTTIRNQNGQVPRWGQALGFELNWSISPYDTKKYAQTYTAIESGRSCDLLLYFDKGTFLIEYFEMNAIVPTRQKIIYCNPN